MHKADFLIYLIFLYSYVHTNSVCMYICTLQLLCVHRMRSALLSRFDLVCNLSITTHLLYTYCLCACVISYPFICIGIFILLDDRPDEVLTYMNNCMFRLDSSYVHMYLHVYNICMLYLICNFTGIRLLVVQTCNVTTFSPCWCKSFFQSVSDICHCQKEF